MPGPAKAGNYRPQTGMLPIQKVITALNTALNKSRNAADRKESKNRKREHAAPRSTLKSPCLPGAGALPGCGDSSGAPILDAVAALP